MEEQDRTRISHFFIDGLSVVVDSEVALLREDVDVHAERVAERTSQAVVAAAAATAVALRVHLLILPLPLSLPLLSICMNLAPVLPLSFALVLDLDLRFCSAVAVAVAVAVPPGLAVLGPVLPFEDDAYA